MSQDTTSNRNVAPGPRSASGQRENERREGDFGPRALVEVLERERRAIGRELHDNLCQHLLGAAFSAKALASILEREKSTHAVKLHDLARLINDAVIEARWVSRSLLPGDGQCLSNALEELAQHAGRNAACSYQSEGDVSIDDPATAVNAYRIAQEAVAAALQQTGAQNIEITLVQSGNSITLHVQDDGQEEGDLTSDPSGVAAKMLRCRARAIHGTISLDFHPGEGTRVSCLFPP